MKKLLFGFVFFPMLSKPALTKHTATSTILAEVRKGDWPINLEKTNEIPHTAYFLEFRDEQVLTSVLLDTLPFADITQLQYFEKALTALKSGNNGDIAKFKDYSLKRSESKKEGLGYILRYQWQWGLSVFRQQEADILINTIRKL